jgi:hypothetical protein
LTDCAATPVTQARKPTAVGVPLSPHRMRAAARNARGGLRRESPTRRPDEAWAADGAWRRCRAPSLQPPRQRDLLHGLRKGSGLLHAEFKFDRREADRGRN